MREIKFRAWDREYLKWLPTDIVDLVFEPDNSVTGVVGNSIVELMQYTGLKDKNGKEIYEGDVVRNQQGRFTVYYNTKAAGFRLKRASKVALIGTNSEVIGNIYENPALLTAPSPDKADV